MNRSLRRTQPRGLFPLGRHCSERSGGSSGLRNDPRNWAYLVWRALLLAGLLAQASPAAAAPPAVGSDGISTSFDLGAALQNVFTSLVSGLGLNAVTDTSPPATHDVSPSTPWTAF